MALWVDKHHEANGHDFIAARIASLESDRDHDGARIRRHVAALYSQLRIGPIPMPATANLMSSISPSVSM